MNEYGIRLTRPISSPAERRRFAAALGPKLKLEPERVERLLAKTGNLIKGAGRERIESMAVIFESCGVNVHVVELEPETASQNTSIRAPVAAVVREATRTIPPKETRATTRAPAAPSLTWDNPAPTRHGAGPLAAPLPTHPTASTATAFPPAAAEPANNAPTVAESLAALRARVKHTNVTRATQTSAASVDLELHDPNQTSVDLTPLMTSERLGADHKSLLSVYSTDAASREWRETQQATQTRPGGWVSLRWKLVGLTMLPLLAASGAWMFSVFTKQANETRALIVQGAIQTAQVFGDGLESSLPESVQARADRLVKSNLLPLKFVLVTNAKGQPTIIAENDATADAGTLEGWRGRHPETSAALMSNVPLALNATPGGEGFAWPSNENPFAQPLNTPAGHLILTTSPLPNKAGATVFGLDADAMQGRVMQDATSSLIQLGAVLLGTALLGWAFASGLTRRLVGLSQAANRVSMGAMSEVIESDGKDEISDLAESVERMRSSLEAALTRL